MASFESRPTAFLQNYEIQLEPLPGKRLRIEINKTTRDELLAAAEWKAFKIIDGRGNDLIPALSLIMSGEQRQQDVDVSSAHIKPGPWRIVKD